MLKRCWTGPCLPQRPVLRGEPTLHPDFPRILSAARDLASPICSGHQWQPLCRSDYENLRGVGLHTLYLQLDGMNDEVYLKMRGQRLLTRRSPQCARSSSTNMRLVLVPTIMSSVNDDQLGPIFSSPWNTTSSSPASAFNRPRMWAALR